MHVLGDCCLVNHHNILRALDAVAQWHAQCNWHIVTVHTLSHTVKEDQCATHCRLASKP